MGAARSKQNRGVNSTLRVPRLVSFVSVAEHTSEKSMPSSDSVIGNWKPSTEIIHLLSMMMVEEAVQNSTALTTAASSSRILHSIPAELAERLWQRRAFILGELLLRGELKSVACDHFCLCNSYYWGEQLFSLAAPETPHSLTDAKPCNTRILAGRDRLRRLLPPQQAALPHRHAPRQPYSESGR